MRSLFLLLLTSQLAGAEPILTSWQTGASGQFARIYKTEADAKAGIASTSWPRIPGIFGGGQDTPAPSGLTAITRSADFVYVWSTGLANHVMGPWYENVAKTRLFRNWPSKQNLLMRFPLEPQPAGKTPSPTPLGPMGLWVNGVPVFNMLDSFVWDGQRETPVPGGRGAWQRDALAGEALTFDPAGAHQPQFGMYHYHISPAGLRSQLGDHIDFDSRTNAYSEAKEAPKHSPILGWAFDGYPIYGPYGFADPKNPTSAVRRMTSGYILRNGRHGTTNLAATGRTSLPPWDASGEGSVPNGPPVGSAHPLGRYIQDYDHLSAHGGRQGVDFDLDESNGRFCITPEFPGGTYAYFVTVDAKGGPVFPYVIGRHYHGVMSGGAWGTRPHGSFTELQTPATKLFTAITPAKESAPPPLPAEVTLKWQSDHYDAAAAPRAN